MPWHLPDMFTKQKTKHVKLRLVPLKRSGLDATPLCSSPPFIPWLYLASISLHARPVCCVSSSSFAGNKLFLMVHIIIAIRREGDSARIREREKVSSFIRPECVLNAESDLTKDKYIADASHDVSSSKRPFTCLSVIVHLSLCL